MQWETPGSLRCQHQIHLLNRTKSGSSTKLVANEKGLEKKSPKGQDLAQ